MHEDDFRNLEPINDLLLVLMLMLLRHGYNDRTRRRLMTPLGEKPYIEIMIFSSGYTREEYSGSEYYPVSQEIVAQLRSGRYVEGRKHMGYTDNNELLLRNHEGIYNEERTLVGVFIEEARSYLSEHHPGIPFPDNPKQHVREGLALEIRTVGYCFVSLKVKYEEGESGAESTYVHRANDKFLLYTHKY